MQSETPIARPVKPKISRVEVYWHTITYRRLVLIILFLAALAAGGYYLFSPEQTAKFIEYITKRVMSTGAPIEDPASKQVRFVNLDGKVQIKKANSVQWINADYQTPLDKGDLIQTGPEGVARIIFADGSTYTVKGNTLVTVEENLVSQDRASHVGVHITSGGVDLATGSWQVPGSKAEVSFANAVASLQQNTHAAVRSDPETNQQEFTVSSGGAQFKRGNEQIDVGQYERLTFPTGGPVTKTDVLAPPALLEPLNLQPLIVADTKQTPVHFSWRPISTAVAYQLQLSATTMFNHMAAEQRTTSTTLDLTGLNPGAYYWRVRAIDAKGNFSDISDPYMFTLAVPGKGQEMLLEVDSTELQGGNVLEVSGRTEPGAALMINGEQVADIRPDGKFHYFTTSLPKGSQTLVITGQNRRGGTSIKRVDIVIP